MPVSPRYHPDPRHPALGEAFFDPVAPAPFPAAVLRFRNDRWAERVGLDTLDEREWIAHFARFEPLPDNVPEPLALRYHGHQFRTYNPDLGDGRGFLFAQVRDLVDGRLLDLATKGSGRTPWSRMGDGRLTLKGGVREVLATEMLEALGVYTSKTFSLIETGEALQRNDEPSPTRASVLVRLGHSHVRIGTFQRLAFLGEAQALERLVAYSIETYHPQAGAAQEPAAALLVATAAAVAAMGAEWFAAGFVHGVLNTDNTVITGESFDYGPWRFLPTLDPLFTAAYFDQTGLYAFGRQPAALHWNLARFADCLRHLVPAEAIEAALGVFAAAFDERLEAMTLARLGLVADEAARERRAAGLFYAALARSKLPFERAFFDLLGGARPERIAASPHAEAYGSEAWRDAIAALREARPVPAQALAHPYFEGEGPVTMLIDEVEALWAPIAREDDWSAFEAKVAQVRRLGEAYAPLLAGVARGRGAAPDDDVHT